MAIKDLVTKIKSISLKEKIVNYASLEEAIKGIFLEIKKKENIIIRTNTPENNAQKVFSAKGALDLLNKLTTQITTAIDECKRILRIDIAKKQNKNDSTLTTIDKTIVGGINENVSKLENLQTTKEDKITRTHVPENDSNKVFTGKGALDLKNWLVTNYTTLMNNIRDSLTTIINGKLSHGGYSGTAQALLNLINSKINKSDISNSVSSTSNSTVASSRAVKTAYDKGIEALSKTNSLAGYKEVKLLWSGSIFDPGSTITLNEGMDKFTFLIIRGNSSGSYSGQQIPFIPLTDKVQVFCAAREFSLVKVSNTQFRIALAFNGTSADRIVGIYGVSRK